MGDVLTLADWAKRLDPDGSVDKVVELLNEKNEILDDMLFLEGNLPTGHRTTVRAGLPTAAWRQLNYGVQPSKSKTKQVTDTCGMLEAYAEVDKDLADLNGNTASFRLSEDKAFLEAMNQQMGETVFYGNTSTNPERFLGVAPRYNDLSADNAENIVSAGESSNLTSIWLIIWGNDSCHGIFPKGAKAGLSHKDLGEVTLEDDSGGRYQGYRTHYQWKSGLVLRDWRYVVRICNINTDNLVKDAASGSDLVDLMTQALEIPPNLNGKAAFYCNRTVKSYLRRQIKNSNNVNISMDEVAGKKVVTFDEVPVRRCDQILNTESQVS